MRGDGEGEFVRGEEEALAFGGGEAKVLLGLGEGGDAMAELPAPVVPFGIGGCGPVAGGVGAEVAGEVHGAGRFFAGDSDATICVACF